MSLDNSSAKSLFILSFCKNNGFYSIIPIYRLTGAAPISKILYKNKEYFTVGKFSGRSAGLKKTLTNAETFTIQNADGSDFCATDSLFEFLKKEITFDEEFLK